MDTVRWTAYDALPGTSPAQVNGSAADFLDVLKRIEGKGVGYVEVCRDENDYPLLALSLAEGRGVVHQFASPTRAATATATATATAVAKRPERRTTRHCHPDRS